MKTEREFAIALKKAMRYARKHKSPQVLAGIWVCAPGFILAWRLVQYQ